MNLITMKSAPIKRSLQSALLLLICAACEAGTPLLAQTKATEKPWQEVVSSEGRFRVLLPDTPSELLVPLNGKILNVDLRIFAVSSPVASYSVMFGDFPVVNDREEIKTAFDSGRDRVLAEHKLRLVSEKDISSLSTFAREYVMDDGAFLIRDRVYYNKGRVYEVVFAGPGVNGMPAALGQYYDGLATKFFNSFKIVS